MDAEEFFEDYDPDLVCRPGELHAAPCGLSEDGEDHCACGCSAYDEQCEPPEFLGEGFD